MSHGPRLRHLLQSEIELAAGPVLVVSTHYESHTDPDDRLLQTRALLDAIDAHAPGMPVLIGGDFNTNTFTRPEKDDPDAVVVVLIPDSGRNYIGKLYNDAWLREAGILGPEEDVTAYDWQTTRPEVVVRRD